MTDDVPLGMLTISDLAREKRVDKSAISRRVARLEGLGLLTTRTTGRVKLVNLAEFDWAIANTGNAVQELNARGAAPEADATGNPILAREQAKRAAYEAEWKRLDLEERLKQLVKTDEVRVSITDCALALAQVIDALPGRAEALAVVAVKEGTAGLRAALKGIACEWREMLTRTAERYAESTAAQEAAEAVEPEEAAA